MMNLAPLMAAGGYACVFSVALTPIVRDVFRSYNVVDRPGRRKVHTYPIPRIGGIPIAIAYVFALNALRGPVAGFPLHWLQTLLSGTAIIFVTGLVDDFLNLKPRVKFGAQIVAALVAYFNGLTLNHLGNTALPIWISLPLTVFWLLLTTNALNLIDGLDGLCGGMAFWAALTFFAVGFTHGNHILAFTALPLCLVLLGFLAFNFNPATVFLGDSGALTLGFLLGCYGIVWSRHQITAGSLAVTLLALTVPLLDLGLSIIRRTLRKQPIFSADRGHIHHMLLHRGFSVRRAALTLYAVAITGGLAGLLLSHTGPYPVLRIVIGAVLVILAFAGIRELRYAEFEVAGRLLFRGEFQRIFAAKLRMKQLAQALERAGSGDERWLLLVAAAGEWNCIALKWISTGGRREELLAPRTASWTLAVHLSETETIQLEGDSETANLPPDLPELSAILKRTFPAEVRELRQPAAP
jgi:UDP-GlcNAc:undecaprenyl-phosphate GlcNAc-1-phosphate transferase